MMRSLDEDLHVPSTPAKPPSPKVELPRAPIFRVLSSELEMRWVGV